MAHFSNPSTTAKWRPFRDGGRSRHCVRTSMKDFSCSTNRQHALYLVPLFEAIEMYTSILHQEFEYRHEAVIISGAQEIVLPLTTVQRDAYLNVSTSGIRNEKVQVLEQRLLEAVNSVCEEVERTHGISSRSASEVPLRLRSFARDLEWYSGSLDVSLPLSIIQYVARVKEAGVLPDDDVRVQLREIGTFLE